MALDEGPIVIGTDPECEFASTDDTVSARHCELAWNGDRLMVRDLASTNGVFLDGVAIIEAVASPKSKIRLGKTEIAIKDAGTAEVSASAANRFGGLVGSSPLMRTLFSQLESVAASPAPLLIEGETGTGKDVAAEAVHARSPRADAPLVLFDCGAAAPSLLEGELFGYEKGAFTGATSSRVGLAESADGGTLVLDEVGELPLELQPKLLRLIERKEVRRLGENDARPVDARIIACTHRSLRAEVKASRFREDLYFRLAALRVRMPSLRERTGDLPELIDHLLRERGSTQRFADLSEADRALLCAHRWPGNIRELRNAVERLLAFPSAPAAGLIEQETGSTAPRIDPGAWPQLSAAREQAQNEFERRYLSELMARSKGSISEGARLAGVSRQFLQRIMRKHGLR
jgi:DNA-binding NtrC family response regulator